MIMSLFHEKKVNWPLFLTRKSIPTVEIKLPERNVPSLNLTRRQVFPTPLSPISITYDKRDIAKETC